LLWGGSLLLKGADKMRVNIKICTLAALALSLIICSLASAPQTLAQITQRETLYVDDCQGAPYYTMTGSTWVYLYGFGWRGEHYYVQMENPGHIGQAARWTPDITPAGYYAVAFYLPPTSDSRNHALYVVSSFGTTPDSSWHDQNYNSGNWINLGVHYLKEGIVNSVMVVNDSTSTSGNIFRADATRFILGPSELDIEPERRNAYAYGQVDVLDHKDWKLRIYNIGGTSLTVQQMMLATNVYFLYEPSIPVGIDPRSYEDFVIRFMPLDDQIFNDTLKIISDDIDEPCIPIPLTGEGVSTRIVVNDDDGPPGYVEEVGEWETANVGASCPGINNLTSRYAVRPLNPGAQATFTPDIPFAGLYRIESALPMTAAASTNALYVIRPGGGATPDFIWLNQCTDQACEWRLLGYHYLVPGRGNSVSVIESGTGSGYVIRADLMKFTYCVPVPVISESPTIELPGEWALHQNYPNPFNTSTEIRYQIPEDEHVSLKIFNLLGQEVRELVNSNQETGRYIVTWDGTSNKGQEVASGLYFCRLRTGNFGKTIKMVLLR
jgi:hypothetical protein